MIKVVVCLRRLSKSKVFFLAIVVVLALVLLIKFTGFERPGLNFAEVFLREALAPAQGAVTTAASKVDSFFNAAFSFIKIRSENEELKKTIEKLKEENAVLKEYREENIRLKKLLGLMETIDGHYDLTAARVIGRNPENWHSTLTIDKGYRHGIEKNMPVISERGVVGRITNVSANTSEVLLITDREGAVAALVQQTRTPGVVEGLGPNTDELQLIHLPYDAPVGKNHVVITSGLGGIFPKGLRIGYVKGVYPEANGLMKRAIVEPFVDFDRLEEVLIVTGVKNQ
ncbi:MAG: rod shape-determining protein MreC [Clostridia bacterium]|nr:rod shape-determining protein MreC [Clostridia bacterium]